MSLENHSNTILVLDRGMENVGLYRLNMCLALEGLGYPVRFIRVDGSERPHVKGNLLTSHGYKVSLSKLKQQSVGKFGEEYTSQTIAFLDTIEQSYRSLKDKNGRIYSFQLENHNGEIWLNFPDVTQDLREVVGLFATRVTQLDIELEIQRQILKENEAICPFIPTDVIRILSDKVATQPILEQAGVPTPTNIYLSNDQRNTCSKDTINRMLTGRGMTPPVVPPYIVKAGHGHRGKQVHALDTLDEVWHLASHYLETDGVIIQEKVPKKYRPDRQKPGYEWLRVVVYGNTMLDVYKASHAGELSAKPDEDRTANTIVSSFRLSDSQEKIVHVTSEALRKLTQGRPFYAA